MKNLNLSFGLLALSFAMFGCDELPTDKANCTGEITVVPLPSNGGKTVRGDLSVKGTADHSGDLTIQRITVGGIEAKKDGFNFNTWSVVVPLGVLMDLAPDENGDRLVPVTATDTCFQDFVTDFPIRAALPIEAITVDATYPEGESYIPANGKFGATIAIAASPSAAGEKVTLQSSDGGTFAGTVGNQIGLSGDGKTDATATVLFTSTQVGESFITAKIESLTSNPKKVRVVGAPALFPSTSTLAAKQTVRIAVTTDGRIESCQATPAKFMTVKSGNVDLMAMPGATDVNNDGTIDIDITAADVVDMESNVTITCRDPFGQTASGTYTVKP